MAICVAVAVNPRLRNLKAVSNSEEKGEEKIIIMRGQTSTAGSRRLFGIVSNGFPIGGWDIKKKKKLLWAG